MEDQQDKCQNCGGLTASDAQAGAKAEENKCENCGGLPARGAQAGGITTGEDENAGA